jgi:hypothetical protein
MEEVEAMAGMVRSRPRTSFITKAGPRRLALPDMRSTEPPQPSVAVTDPRFSLFHTRDNGHPQLRDCHQPH